MGVVGRTIGKPWGRRLPVSVGGVAAKTEAEFNAHIATLATDGAVSWTGEISLPDTTTRRYRTTSAAFSGSLFGSPYGSYYGASAGGFNTVARIVQHCLPDGDLSGATASRQIYFETTRSPSNMAGVSRTINGFTSSPLAGGAAGSATVTRVIWWDGDKAMTRDPFAMSAATQYVW